LFSSKCARRKEEGKKEGEREKKVLF